MGWRFRRSFKVIPGVRLNLSKSGLSASFGGAPLTINVGRRGVYGTASIPGTGISFRQRLGSEPEPDRTDSFLPPHVVTPESLFPGSPPVPFRLPSPSTAVSTLPVEEVRSASTELLTSESLKELRRLLQTTHQEHEEISSELATARDEKQTAFDRWFSWDDGFLLKRIFKKRFALRKAVLETAEAKVTELEEQLRMTTIATHIEIDREQAEPYFRMRDAFAALSECKMIWDIKSHQATDRFRERTTANMRVNRERVQFSLADCNLIQWEQKVPHIQNAKSGDMFLYPGFILYRAASEAFSVIGYHDVHPTLGVTQFQEEDGVPTDSKVVGHTWAKANKDGGPDRRFANNYQIPIALYGCWTLKSESGLWEEFQFSNPERLKTFLEAWNTFVRSFAAPSATPSPTIH